MLGALQCFRCHELGHCYDECPRVNRTQLLLARPRRPGPHTLGRPRHAPAFAVGRPASRAGAGHHVVGKRATPAAAAFLLGGRAGELADNDGVYVLELPDGRYYVGKSHCVAERLRQHAAGQGAACAKGYLRRAVPLTPRGDDLEAWERAETLARMRRHGIGRVRGWMYTAPEMSEALREHAYQQVCERYDLCRRCGRDGHFAASCAGTGARPEWATQ